MHTEGSGMQSSYGSGVLSTTGKRKRSRESDLLPMSSIGGATTATTSVITPSPSTTFRSSPTSIGMSGTSGTTEVLMGTEAPTLASSSSSGGMKSASLSVSGMMEKRISESIGSDTETDGDAPHAPFI